MCVVRGIAVNALTPTNNTMPPRKPGTIDWRNSESKQIVLDDLESGQISLDAANTAEDLCCGMCQFAPEFIAEEVGFDQFKKRLEDHRKQLEHKIDRSEAMAALEHDRLIFPQKTHNARGEKIFCWTEAFGLLKQDVAAKKHTIMTPSQLHKTRPEHKEFSLTVFDRKIRQAIRKERLVNWKNDKREADIKERKERRRALGLNEETPMEERKRASEQG